ncbi:non-ribosomal peptide synthetase [Methylophilus sp. OH31]|uniref:non-ribosomal peptide synthetase n=1 Tax=Methylophilus sp. OH31 TaxID=1387312 RepID=UPI000466EABF|nr:non-ribosomal peptide synthetase [Methylophilus sp. OH31]
MNPTLTRLPTTSAQYGIWMGQQMVPDSPSYLTAEAISLHGIVDIEALRQSVTTILDNCQTLHMRFEMDNEGLWQWPQPAATVLEYHDFRQHDDPETAAWQWAKLSLSTLCRPTEDALYRTALLQLADDKHLWIFQVHHIALDGYGYGMVCQAVAARYSALVSGQPLPPLPDWSLDKVLEAERSYKANGKFERDQAFWINHLQHAPASAVVAPAQDFSDDVLRHGSRLNKDAVAGLEQAASQCGQDWGSWMLAAIGLWLARQSGQQQLTFGLPVMNRLGTPALGIPCMAMNIVPMSIHVAPEHSMQSMSKQLADSLRTIRPHLYYRYGWIRGDLGLLEIQKHLFNQAVNIMPFDRHAPFAGLESSIHPISAGPVKDLNISVFVLNGEWQLLLEANPNAYSSERLATLHQDLSQWLQQLVAYPPHAALAPLLQDLPALSLLHGPALTQPAQPVLQRLYITAFNTPERTALEWYTENGAHHALSYGMLLDQMIQMATHLQANGLQAQDRVVILLPRSPEAIIAILATLWAGACYVPLDPLGPAGRLEMVLADAAPQQVITQQAWAHKAGVLPVLCIEACTAAAQTTSGDSALFSNHALSRPVPVNPEDPAYLLYTSGSTGKPNGVLMSHRALAHFVASAGQLYEITADDRVLQFAPLHFDASIEEIFLSLCHGATLILRSDAVLDSISAFTGFVQQARISVLDLPTAYWHELSFALTPTLAAALDNVRLTIIGGEAALAERARRWQALLPTNVLLNSYGPTEASVIATTAILSGKGAVWDGSDQVPIGLPRPGVQALIVDERLYPVAVGKPGELLLCGDALALHYHQNAALTAQRFITPRGALPAGTSLAEQAYRTGDLVRWHQGQLQFLGRLDNEVKISGLRIDPAEVENALLANPTVREVAVLAMPRIPTGVALAAFVACDARQGDEPTSRQAELRRQLTDVLPAAALPDHWHFMPSLPRNLNGKIDRKQLSTLVAAHTTVALPEATSMEQKIMQVWYDVLGEMPEDVHSNFFELGGKSLQAIQVSSKLGQLLQREIAISALFNHATVQALAKALSAPVAHQPPSSNTAQAFAPMLTIQPGAHPALFCLHPAEGLSWCYLGLARHLPGIAIYGLQATASPELPTTFEAMVESYVTRVRQTQAHGPYRLLGWSLGGALAQAMATRLQQQGEQVELVALMDSYPAHAFADWREPTLHDALITLLSVTGEVEADTPEAIYQRLLRHGSPLAALGRDTLEQLGANALRGMQLFRASQTPLYQGDLLLFQAGEREPNAPQPASWLPYIQGRLDCVVLHCNHFGMSDPAPMAAIGQALAERLQASHVHQAQEVSLA